MNTLFSSLTLICPTASRIARGGSPDSTRATEMCSSALIRPGWNPSISGIWSRLIRV
jgi:hypothetical protein